MSIMIRGSVSSVPAETDASGNLTANLPFNTTTGTQGGGTAKAGFAALAAESDPGTVTLARTLRQLEATTDYRLRCGLDTVLFQDTFAGSGSVINTGLWQQATTVNGATVTVSAGFAILSTVGTANSHAVLRSRPTFTVFGTFPTYFEHLVKFNTVPGSVAVVVEWGYGIIDTTTNAAAPTDGAFFRIDASGNLSCRIAESGTETVASPALTLASVFAISTTYHTSIVVHEDAVEFWVNDVLVGTAARATAGSSTTRAMSASVFQRVYSVAGAIFAAAFSNVFVSQADMDSGRTWNEIQAKSGKGAYQGPTGGTLGTTAQISNSANPAAATPTNTTAALGTGLGGIFLANAQATAATDFIISSYQVPAATAAAPGNNLLIHGVRIGTINTGAAVATTPTTIEYFLCFGHTAVSLATTESSTTKAPRRISLGTQTYAVGAVVGAVPANGDIERNWKVPKVVYPGEFVQVVARFVVGTATASQVINHYIDIDAAWD